MRSGLNSMLDSRSSGRKLLGGLFRIVSVCLFYVYLGPSWVKGVQNSIISTLSDNPDSAGANLVAKIFGAAIALWALYWFVLGIYRTYTFNMYMDVYECEISDFQRRYMTDIDPEFSNINDALRYRDAKMKTMSTDRAAEFYKETSSLLNSTNNKAVLGYINSKMSMMSSEQRVNFLRGKK
jgi:hypothetical protein